jgi:hypothetical protein
MIKTSCLTKKYESKLDKINNDGGRYEVGGLITGRGHKMKW